MVAQSVIRGLIISTIAIVTVGCGGGSQSHFSSQVDSVAFRDDTITPGAETTLNVFLNPGADISGYDSDGEPNYRSEEFSVTVFLPEAISLVANGSRLSEDLFGDVLFGNPDPKEPMEQGRCSDGRQFVRYFFEQNELGDTVSNTLSSVYLKIDMIVPASAHGQLVGAAISWSHNACEEESEESDRINVGN